MRRLVLSLAVCLAVAVAGCGTRGAGGGTDGSAAKNGGGADGGATDGGNPGRSFWVSAYLTSWSHIVGDTDGNGTACGNWGVIRTSDIDWSAFTDLIYFAITANADGSITRPQCYHDINADRLLDIVPAAHAHGKPILITVGGAGDTGFSTAIASSATRTTLVNDLVAFVTKWHFDGVDVDLEPFNPGDVPGFVAFVKALHAKLSAMTTPMSGHGLMTTAAVSGRAAAYAQVEGDFDQVNLMTYDLAGMWEGWPSWYNNAVESGSVTSIGGGKPAPSIDGEASAAIAAGVSKAKLGVGIDFNGYVWADVDAADLTARTCTGSGITTAGVFWSYYDASGRMVYCTPLSSAAQHVIDNVPYHNVLKYLTYASPSWDPAAEASYLSIPNTVIALDMNGNGTTTDGITTGGNRGYEGNGQGTPENLFVSYDDPRAVKAIVAYAKQKGLGGVILWDLGDGWLPNGDPANPSGPKDPLLQAIKEAVQAP